MIASDRLGDLDDDELAAFFLRCMLDYGLIEPDDDELLLEVDRRASLLTTHTWRKTNESPQS